MSDRVADTSAAVEKLEEQQRETTRKRALDLAPEAIDVVSKLMKGHLVKGKQRATPTTMLRAAEVVLAQAHGRPEVRDRRTGQADAGLTIIVNQLTTGEKQVIHGSTVNPAEDIARGVLDGLQAAQVVAQRSTLESDE